MGAGQNIIDKFTKEFSSSQYLDLHWTGSFEEYLDIVAKNPQVARSASQRLYDMILTYGTSEYIDNKKKEIVKYKHRSLPRGFSSDEEIGQDSENHRKGYQNRNKNTGTEKN